MKNMKWNRLMLTLLGVIIVACASPSARASQASLTRKELNALIASARTPQDHERLASYFRGQARLAKENQADHEEMLLRYRENPTSHRFTKSPSPDDHCRTLIRIFADEAQQNTALAEYHKRMAIELGKKK
ncbi:MAG TPA: hypothetical protein VNM47_17895 [Terriglobia bacterium]|nr:hypothetical protein [Terriglobia bacterium]